MKRILQLFSLAAFFPFAAQSQITIQADQIQMVGNLAINSRDTLPDSTIVVGGIGTQVWNFTGLNNDEQDTLRFYEADDLPYANEFPLANVGVQVGSDVYVFFEQNNEHIATYGSFGSFEYGPFNLTTTFKYNPPLTSIRFPMQLNDAYNETVIGKIQLPGSEIGISSDSVRAITTNRRFVSVDAFGEMSTPFGSFQTLRSKEVEVTTDTVYILSNGIWFPAQGSTPDTITLYSWWTNQNGLGFPLVQLTVKNNVVKEAGWLNAIVSSTNNPSQLLRLAVSPNPAANFINVELPEGFQGRLEVYDMNGKQCQTTPIAPMNEQLDVQQLATGSYVLVLKDKQGRLSGFEKILITK